MGQHFSMDLRKLKEDLALYKTQVHQQQRLLDELCLKVGMKPKNNRNRGLDHREARMKNPPVMAAIRFYPSCSCTRFKKRPHLFIAYHGSTYLEDYGIYHNFL